VALPLLAATLTRDPVLVAGLTTLAFLPWLLFGLLSGALVDRTDRRRAMAAARLLRAAALGALGLAAVLDAAGIPVQSSYRTLVWGAMPLGAAAGGGAGRAHRRAGLFVVGGLVNTAAAVAVWRVLRAHRQEVEEAFGMADRTSGVAPE